MYTICSKCRERIDIAQEQCDTQIECVCGHRFVPGQLIHQGRAHPRGFSPLQPEPAPGMEPLKMIALFGGVGLVLVVFMSVVLELSLLTIAVITGLLLLAIIAALLAVLALKNSR